MNEVLKVSIQEFNEDYSLLTIDYQDDDEIKRGHFEFEAKNGIEIISQWSPDFGEYTLYLKGNIKKEDNKPIIIPNDRVQDVLHAVVELNKKYKKPWRAEKGESYFYLNFYSDITVKILSTMEGDTIADEWHYLAGNYFKTKEQAQKAMDILNDEVLPAIKKVLKEVKEND